MTECSYEIRGKGFSISGEASKEKFAKLKRLMEKLAHEMHTEPTTIGAQKYELYDDKETDSCEPYISGLL